MWKPGLKFLVILIFVSSARTFTQPLKVEVACQNGFWKLLVNDQSYDIRGVVGHEYLQKVKQYGGNSIRTGWHKEQLDEAHKLGLTALVNLPAGAERDGMNYDDTATVRAQTETIRKIVKENKDHPAILMWAIGNELDYIPPLEPFDPRVWDAVNQAARAIHVIDPGHPVMTVIGTSMMHKVADIVMQCPDIDLLGINTYGDLYTLPDTLKKYGWKKPYVITEWGPDGYWEVPRTPWGAPYEQTGREKYQCYKKKYLSTTEPGNQQCLGSYVFYWSGFKQETTHTWFCMFEETGLESPLVGLMHYLWTGNRLRNEAPIVDSVNIGNYVHHQSVVLEPGYRYPATASASDPDDDTLTYRWEIRPEATYASYAGQGEKVPEPVGGLADGQARRILFRAPDLSGPYRLFVYAYDNHGHFSTANIPFFVKPAMKDTASFGRYTSRTMNLLHKENPGSRDTVKILVYGQSISEQEWWLEVRQFLQERFPAANIRMQNKAIGGFAAQLLYKTTEMDVSSWYPDLVLLHIYGDPHYYDSVLYTIRSRTAAEVAIMTDHYTGTNAWSDTMSYYILTSLAEKYKCDLINIRDPWKKFLSDRNIEPGVLLSDGTHLNKYGNFFMAELVKTYFNKINLYPDDPFDLETRYFAEIDFAFRGDTLTFPFYGNKIDIYVNNKLTGPDARVKVLVDGQPPSAFQGTYFISRPFHPDHREWPWSLPAMIRIRHTRPWVAETWTCLFTQAEIPYHDFSFSISGSVTGPDGKGNSRERFSSRSGRVIIEKGDAGEGGDWHLNRSYQVLKTLVEKGDSVQWKTYHLGMDSIPTGSGDEDPSGYVLFQGIPNTKHVLMLVNEGSGTVDVEELRIFKPYWK